MYQVADYIGIIEQSCRRNIENRLEWNDVQVLVVCLNNYMFVNLIIKLFAYHYFT